MATLLPRPTSPAVRIDPGLREYVTFDTQAFYDLARDAGHTNEQIAGYTAEFRSDEGRAALSTTAGKYTRYNRTGKVFVGSCVRMANQLESQGVPSDDPFLSLTGITETTPFDAKVTAIINNVTIHEFGHDVNARKELPFRHARVAAQTAIASTLPALPWGLIQSRERPAIGLGTMALWLGGAAIVRALNPSSPQRDPSERETYHFQQHHADRAIVTFNSH